MVTPVPGSFDSAILRLVGEVMGSTDRDDFGRSLIHALHRAIPSDWTSLNDIGPNPQDSWSLVDPVPPEELYPLFIAYADQNPLISRYRETQDGRAYRFSDLITREELHQLPLYTEVYGKLDVEEQIAICLPSERGHVFGIALSRSTNYTDDERDLLNEARPYLIQAYRNALELELLRAAVDDPAHHPAPPADLALAGLTDREREVVRLVATGQTNQNAADALGLSVRTVQKHLERAFRKLGVKSRTEAAVRFAAATQPRPPLKGMHGVPSGAFRTDDD